LLAPLQTENKITHIWLSITKYSNSKSSFNTSTAYRRTDWRNT